MNRFHRLETMECELPSEFTFPFCYVPHPLCIEAKAIVEQHLVSLTEWKSEVAAGKMFGVLVCQGSNGEVGFLAAYSGQIGGREDWPWFVPAVFDYLQPDGHFKREEARISAINRSIDEEEHSPRLLALKEQLRKEEAEAEEDIAAYRHYMQEAKQRRDEQRRQQPSEETEAALQRESQHQKAELRRLRHRWEDTIAATRTAIEPLAASIASKKALRKSLSDSLQQWLFNQFVVVNAKEEKRTLNDIFAETPQRVPPSGTGECCAPKLLQYAFSHSLKPLCMAEFWQGASPQGEVRHHGQFYPACSGKCKPILSFMLQGLRVEPDPRKAELTVEAIEGLNIIYHDDSIAVVNKPSGMLSVPGRSRLPSVATLLKKMFPSAQGPLIVHRLDQDTSGLLVCALTTEAYHSLQRQFTERTVEKRYTAIVDGTIENNEGTISLPLRANSLDRPRQMVDFGKGKEAITYYQVEERKDGKCRLTLKPHTGRTHQLRLHCAHAKGLNAPIIGDTLYGHQQEGKTQKGQRLMLHATDMSFTHPVTGKRLTFHSPAPF